jgi:hypothetical protein
MKSPHILSISGSLIFSVGIVKTLIGRFEIMRLGLCTGPNIATSCLSANFISSLQAASLFLRKFYK